MKIVLNEKEIEVEPGSKIEEVVEKFKPEADILIKNGYPATPQETLEPGNTLVLIKRGEKPNISELEFLLSARHTPGVYEKLKKATVGIAGCGGLGSCVANALARVGIGCLILADFDVVEPSNLNRQQYFVDQIGMLKVEALKENLQRVNPVVKIKTFACRLDKNNIPLLFGATDVLVEAFDRADQKYMLVETAATAFPSKPLVLGVGMAGYGANHLIKVRQMGNWFICGDEQSEAAPGHGLMAPRVGVVGHMQANQVMEIILGSDSGIVKSIVGKKDGAV
ncbi:MAG: sulfur carrier protein ThiS adenylyltransferase ThiF [Candidatus Riflebacteria bacterium]|nr:sulfur carrier protein ThiS adenylyltransferase ThiF [Candidatus Riflebacteria bacterium]